MRAPIGLSTPALRLVRGSLPKDAQQAPSCLMHADTAQARGFKGLFSSFGDTGLGDGVVGCAAGTWGTKAARLGERGANTPEKPSHGYPGGGMSAESLAMNARGESTRGVAPLRRDRRSRYATRPSDR